MPDGLIVGTLSVLRPQKALESMLDAMPAITAAVPEAKLVIVGNGPIEPKLRAHARNLALDVTWLPFEPASSCRLEILRRWRRPSLSSCAIPRGARR
jgi:glycosyltransferase involved in cell wall biosynthesis